MKEILLADTFSEDERANAYQRTFRAARTAAHLDHPAIVSVYDVCEDEGRPWIIMQLVHGQSLDQALATSGRLSPRRAAEVGLQLLSALSVAHAGGVLHRDVKPSNVLLGEDDRAVLTDFGIATFQGDPKLTMTGFVMGAPGYTAPERIRGEDTSPASDLWSLGATLFAAVEGHGPFEGRGGAITTMSAIVCEDAPEASTAGPLGPVVTSLLRREPAERPGAAEAIRLITSVFPPGRDLAPTVVPEHGNRLGVDIKKAVGTQVGSDDIQVSDSHGDPTWAGGDATPMASPSGATGFSYQGHAFISYVREDSAEVDALQRTLEAAGIPVWRDTGRLWPGEDWRTKIRDAITHDALVFIACFSTHSVARQKSYQYEELLLAIDQLRIRRPDDPWLIPVRLDDCDVPDLALGAGRTLASIQRADLFGMKSDLATARLVEAVKRLLR